MRKANMAIAQSLLNHGCSIDETARLMTESGKLSYWKREIIKCIEKGELTA